jgi:alkanesulfonate monooxygenase SsuD/methylene tetrahydromethanopterin reductase-like flavin-dependent oxidoreductase (luciferase family)
MQQVDAAERWGLDVMWLAGSISNRADRYLSAPFNIASAIAARTRRIKIGIAVQVLPLCHPLRLTEEAATVDQLSHGRLIFGVGRSGVAQTYQAYGVSYAKSRERFREILDIIERARTEPSFSYEGTYHSFKNVAVVPKPYRKPTPGRQRGIPAKAKSSSRRRPISPKPTSVPAPSRGTASCTSITRGELLEGAARLVDPETAARHAAGRAPAPP